MVSGLMPDTPLGAIISIRGEKNRDRIKDFTPGQHKIRAEWGRFLASKNTKNIDIDQQMMQLEQMISGLFGGGKGEGYGE